MPDPASAHGERGPLSRRSGEHERHLAVGTLGQQAAQAFAVLAMLGVVTALGRSLSLAEFGTYGLVVSFSAYLLFVQGSVEAPAIKEMAEATTEAGRDRAFTTAVAVYAGLGLLAGALIALAGLALLEVFKIPKGLEAQGRLGVVAIGATTVLGWPLKTYQDALRASQLFLIAAAVEIVAYALIATGMFVLLFVADAPLWTLMALSGSIPLFIGATSLIVVIAMRLPYRFNPAELDRPYTRRFLGMSGYVLLSGVTDLIVYSLDRAILAVFRSAATVGLYEATVRPHNLIRQLHGSLGQTVLPASSQYLAEGDTMRLRELLIRGTRYTLAVTVPVTVTFMVLAKPILDAWLGAKFGAAATALTIFVSYWLWSGSNAVSVGMLVAAGRFRQLLWYSWGVALVNLAVSLALTPVIGLEGVVVATTVSAAVWFPYFVRLTLTTFEVSLREYLIRGFLPAYATGAGLAAALGLIRATVHLSSPVVVAVVAAGGVLAYWLTIYTAWLNRDERVLIRELVRLRRPGMR